MGFIPASPFAKIVLPPQGARERILSRLETVRLLRAATPAFRAFLIGMRQTIARPQEVRGLLWSQQVVVGEGQSAFVLKKFKGKKRRKDGLKVRIIPVDPRLARLLVRLRRRRLGKPLWIAGADQVFLNARGAPGRLTPSAARWPTCAYGAA